MFITVITLFFGENFLANKVMDTFGIEEKKYKRFLMKLVRLILINQLRKMVQESNS